MMKSVLSFLNKINGMKKCIICCSLAVLCAGCLTSEDIDYFRLGAFSDADRQAGWTDADYDAYYHWFHQRFGDGTGNSNFEIIHNRDEIQPYLQYGLIDDTTLKKVNFDKQVVLAVAEGVVAAKDIYIVKDYSSVISYTLVYDKNSPQCCKENCSQEEFKDRYVSMYAVERIITEHEFMKSVDKCE